MQTKYPKTKKTKVITNKASSKNQLADVIAEQQYQIDELQAKATKTDVETAYTQSQKENWNKAYGKMLLLQDDLAVTNSHACYAHTRIDAIDLQLSTIVADGETAKTDLSALTQKVTLNTQNINKNETDIINLQNSDELQNQSIEDLQMQISNLQQDMENNQSNVDLTEVYDLINQNTQGINDINNNLGAQVAQNTENIMLLTTDVAQLNTTVSAVENTNYDISQQLEQTKTDISQNQADIDALQNQVDINTQKIEALQNADPNTTELDLIDLTQRVQTNEQNIAALATQQNTNTADIASLMLFKQRFTTPTDTTYNPKTYSDFPAGTIVQTYACYERDLAMNGSGSIVSPAVFFVAEPGSAGTIKLQLGLSTEAESGTVAMEVVVGTTVVDKIYVDIVAGNNTINHTVYNAVLNAESRTNKIFCRLKYDSTVKATLNYFKVELLAPNADVITNVRPYNVEYIDGTYYVSDCTSGTVKLATIKAEDMYNMQSLQFEDLGLEAQTFNIGVSTEKYADTYKTNNTAYAYLTKENKFYFYSKNHDKTTAARSDYHGFDFMINTGANVKYATTDRVSGIARYYVVYDSNGNASYGGLSNNLKNVLITNGFKFLMPYSELIGLTIYASITTEGEVILNNYNTAANNLSLGYGTHVKIFLTTLRGSRDYDLKVYVKKYDKLVQYDITFNNSTIINSVKEIGPYDDIFLGVKGDYFAVKNGKLSYHFFPTEEQTTENTETSITE